MSQASCASPSCEVGEYECAPDGALQATLTPDLGHEVPDVLYVTYFATHGGVVAAALLAAGLVAQAVAALAVVAGWPFTARARDARRTVLVGGALAGVVGVLLLKKGKGAADENAEEHAAAPLCIAPPPSTREISQPFMTRSTISASWNSGSWSRTKPANTTTTDARAMSHSVRPSFVRRLFASSRP